MRYMILFLFVFCFTRGSFAGTVDTISIYSNGMHRNIKAVVIKPDSYKKKKNRFPVVYLLHGYDGWYSNWIIREPRLKAYADIYQTIIVCPDGAKDSWYFDSPVDSTYRYETHVVDEVVGHIDNYYRTVPDKAHRAITGLSMGGHGALFLALRHPDIFGAAASMSGCMDLTESKNSYDIQKRIGDTNTLSKTWQNMTIISMIEKYPGTSLKIAFDCGEKDFFINGNRRLHEKMLQLKIPHEYTERPGQHSWDYWRNSISYHLLFFQKFFSINPL
jgi:S-formylglutathione hydrolase FrmB